MNKIVRKQQIFYDYDPVLVLNITNYYYWLSISIMLKSKNILKPSKWLLKTEVQTLTVISLKYNDYQTRLRNEDQELLDGISTYLILNLICLESIHTDSRVKVKTWSQSETVTKISHRI